MDLKFDEHGLIPAVCQDHIDGSVRMVGWMNEEAVRATVRSKKATFFSRSRQRLWTKGETSGHTLDVLSIHADCDADTLLLRVRAHGPTCHTGQSTCFFQPWPAAQGAAKAPPATFLHQLEDELERRRSSSREQSYTKFLLEGGPSKIREKLLEESAEFTHALESETDDRVAGEAADVLYHLLVGLQLRDVSFDRVCQLLEARSTMSGHEEKSQRSSNRSNDQG